jgi:hypothetical protein
LQEKILILQTELELQTARADQIKKAYLNAKDQIHELRGLTDEVEQNSKTALLDENESWQRITGALKVPNQYY